MMWKNLPIMFIKRKITKRFAQCESMVLMWVYFFKYLSIYVCVSPYIKKLSHCVRKMAFLRHYFSVFLSYLFQNVCNEYVCVQIETYF